MRRYETTYVLRPNLGEEQFSEIIERTNSIVTGDGGSIINLERLGNRKLAYEIKKETLGQYIYFDYAAPGSTIQEMERIFRIDDRVLRFLTVKLADSIDESTVVSEIERAAAIAAEKTTSETEVEAEEASVDSDKEKTVESEDKKEVEIVEEAEVEEAEEAASDETTSDETTEE
jgi:small subunit ribosomal protein S6